MSVDPTFKLPEYCVTFSVFVPADSAEQAEALLRAKLAAADWSKLRLRPNRPYAEQVDLTGTGL